MKNTSIICIDLAKSKFQAGLFNKHNILKSNKQYSESALLKFVAISRSYYLYGGMCHLKLSWSLLSKPRT